MQSTDGIFQGLRRTIQVCLIYIYTHIHICIVKCALFISRVPVKRCTSNVARLSSHVARRSSNVTLHTALCPRQALHVTRCTSPRCRHLEQLACTSGRILKTPPFKAGAFCLPVKLSENPPTLKGDVLPKPPHSVKGEVDPKTRPLLEGIA